MAEPWLKFYPTDWRADPALRMCSLAARGLWIEILALMHEATPYGYFLVSGRSPTDAQLAVLVGAPSEQITELLGELEAAGVFSRTKEGVIYSRKMTRTAKKAAIARKNGKNGGNPSLCNKTTNRPSDNPQDKGGVKPQKPEARSQTVREGPKGPLSSGDDAPPPRAPDEVQSAFEAYNRAAEASGWPRAQVLSKTRRSGIAARLRECGGIAGWAAALAKAQASPLCCGQNDRGWLADLDFIIQPKSFTRLMEGAYDNRAATRQSQQSPGGQRRADPALEQIARLTGLSEAPGYGRC